MQHDFLTGDSSHADLSGYRREASRGTANTDEQKLIKAFKVARDLDFKIAIESEDHEYGEHIFILVNRLLEEAERVIKIAPNYDFTKIEITFDTGEKGELSELHEITYDWVIGQCEAFLNEYACSKIIDTKKLTLNYITNHSGDKTAVLLPIEEFEQLLEDMQNLAVVAERRSEPTTSHKNLLAELKEDGIF